MGSVKQIHSNIKTNGGRFLKNMTLADWPYFADGDKTNNINTFWSIIYNHFLDKEKITVKRIANRDKEFDNCQVKFKET